MEWYCVDDADAAKELVEKENPVGIICAFTDTFRKLAAVVPHPDSFVIEIGFSYGECSKVILQALGESAESKFLGVDNSKDLLHEAKARCPHANFEVFNVLQCPLLLVNAMRRRNKELELIVFVDIGGNRDFESVAVLVSWLEKGLPDGILPPLKIVVKSENLFSLAAAESEKTQRVSHESWTSIQTLAKQRIAARRQAPSSSDSTNTESLPSPASSSSTASAADTPDHPQEEILRDQPLTAKQRRAAQLVAALHDSIAGDHERSPSAAGAIRRFPHPLKFPQRVNNDGQAICRFHNYDRDKGCLRYRDLKGIGVKCPLDHEHCHACGGQGHIALDCEAALPLL